MRRGTMGRVGGETGEAEVNDTIEDEGVPENEVVITGRP